MPSLRYVELGPASGFVVCTKFRHGLNLMGTEMHALLRLWWSISPCINTINVHMYNNNNNIPQ